MDLLPTEEQDEIVATVRTQLERNFDLHTLASADGAASVIDRELWARCADLGWFGLGLDESLGGVGYTLVEEALLFAEVGAHATPGPFLATVLSARLAALAGASELAAGILSGEQIVALAEPHGPGDATTGATVAGTFRVTDHGGADLVLVLVDDSAALVTASDLVAEPMASLDLLVPTAIGTVTGIPALAHLDDASALRLRATVLVASELAGIATAVTRQTPDRRPAGGWLPEQRITLTDALAAYTSGTAFQCFDDTSGALVEGAPADLAVLGADLTRLSGHELADVTVLSTWRCGERTTP